jgi:hypothetical protein
MTTKPQKIEMTKQTKQPEGIVEKFENEVASGGIFDIDGNDITDETFIFIQSQADKTREQVLGGVLRSVQPRGAIRCTWCKMATMDCECKENLEELINKLKNK